MYYLNVWLTVKDPADVEAIRKLLAEHQRLTRLEPGCVRFEVYHSEVRSATFLLHEHWASKQAWEVHRTGQGGHGDLPAAGDSQGRSRAARLPTGGIESI